MLKPMLAPNQIPQESEITFPVLVSRKLDGLRCLLFPGQDTGLMRSGDPFRSQKLKKFLAPLMAFCLKHGYILDGELYSETASFQEIMSCLRSETKALP